MSTRTQDVQNLEPTIAPTREDVVFAAGFYEGEGACVRCKPSMMPVVSIAQKDPQKDPEMLYRLRDRWGGSLRQSKTYSRHASKALSGYDSWQNPFWKWYVSGDRARVFLQAIYPMLSTRRKEQINKTDAFTLSGRKPRTTSHLVREPRSQNLETKESVQ